MSNSFQCDLLIIGGGINGTGIAADAAGRGLSVVLCEKNDLASGTSSASTKLIHGGLRYLEQFDFKLVREALREREILLKTAAHLVHPLKFILPQSAQQRSAWLIQCGLFLYDHLYLANTLPRSGKIKLAHQILKSTYQNGFSYFDCQTDDARLTIANAQRAQENGAKILLHTECVSAKRENDHWQVELCKAKNEKISLTCKAIVNATGPWAAQVLENINSNIYSKQLDFRQGANEVNKRSVQLVHEHCERVCNTAENSSAKSIPNGRFHLDKGSHIVVPKLYDENCAYILQNNDQRVIFAIPYQEQFTLIGTTDSIYNADLNKITVTSTEIEYLCNAVNQYFSKQISAKDVVWSYCGVRGLYDVSTKSAAKLSREYHLEMNAENNNAPLLTVFGGKLTTYRSLAENVLAKLKNYFPTMRQSWTTNAFLPGSDLGNLSFDEFVKKLQQEYPWLPKYTLHRYAKSYGSLTCKLLGDSKSIADLGQHFGADLYEREVRYLIEHEWAQTAEDVLWRRSKLGLVLNATEKDNLRILLDIKN